MKFYSEKLDKLFDTEDSLIQAETAAEKEKAEKAEKAKAKKAEALAVEEAFKARNAAVTEYNEKIAVARKLYAESLKNLRADFDGEVAAETKKLDAAEKAYDAALKEFIAKHPEGYHMTLKDGDNVITLHSDNKTFDVADAFKAFDLMDLIFRV